MKMTQNEPVFNIDNNTFICMPRAVGYNMYIQLCYAYKELKERLTKENNDDERKIGSNA